MKNTILLSEEKIVNHIYFIRGKKVMLDKDLAKMYGVVTKNLNKSVKRNLRRFPDDFMFQLTRSEWENLMFQFGTSNLECQTGIPSSVNNEENLRFQSGTSSLGHGGARYLPYVFTEQGVAMLSSVLNSETAIDVNIQIIRVFTRMREVLLSQKELMLKIESLEKKMTEQKGNVDRHDQEIRRIFIALKQLMQPVLPPMKKVGYKRKNED